MKSKLMDGEHPRDTLEGCGCVPERILKVRDDGGWTGKSGRGCTFCEVSWTSYTAGGSSVNRPMRTLLTSYASARATTVAARSSVHSTTLPHNPNLCN